jgi:multiple sugar transport system permease protein
VTADTSVLSPPNGPDDDATRTAPSTADPARRRRRRGVTRLVPLLPAMALLVLFFLGPILWSLYAAFTNAALTGPGARDVDFVGLDNFTRLLHDEQFGVSIVLTIVFTLASGVIGQNLLGLSVALLLRGRSRWLRNAIGVVMVGAWVLPEIVAAFAMYAFFSGEGTMNSLLAPLGLPTPEWLVDNPMLVVVLANIWRGTAFSMMVYTAALSEIPTELEEAAAVDGAHGWRRLWLVTLPLIRRSILTNLMVVTLQTLAVFTLIFVITGGGPAGRTQTVALYMYQQAFKFFQLGQGTAIALVLLALGGVFSFVYLRLLKPEV